MGQEAYSLVSFASIFCTCFVKPRGNDWNPQACGAEGEEAILAVNVALCLPRLMRFCLMVKQGFALDGFVFEVRGKSYSSDLTSFALTVRRVLAGLSAGDPSGTDCFKGKIEGRGWYFQFAREPFFVTTFAPCYDESHPRFQFHQSSDSCFILLQPEESFLRHDLPPDKPRSATSWERPADVRDRIRANFRRHGREYRIPETTSYPPADFIVAPLDALHDPPVRFWESTRQQADKKESSARAAYLHDHRILASSIPQFFGSSWNESSRNDSF